ncbi:MAG: hypothetical protein COT26_00320 [Candidatus Kerfeldbacteria bacterium CG08_land_8_20_14_0_20_43_14]|uniref:Uncharacterized protein n=1 Tax=Candidatus Kerfeldbacteria bacterium CG08_land_8_20_14_0_20_43_14 TaxID=2014246 RepID=A0A2H0YR82_9BACT|nr:MAG: hypothetical protein COT26_00320 [Candidatus Kerfeldbacteria bacterium CG08_land_8_20_14_0_20_43_14]
MSNDKTAFEVPLGKATSAFTKLLRELSTDGKQVIEKLDDDPTYARRIARFMRAGGYSPSTDQKRAREIMGSNFLGVEDVIKHFGISLTDDEVSALWDIPFPESVLQERKNTHILFPGYPLTILDIRGKVPRELFRSLEDAWYNGEKFAKKEKVALRWYLIRKDIIQNSTGKTYQGQTALLADTEEIPRACEVVYMIILYYLVYQKRLFESLYGRCADVSSSGYRVDVGSFDLLGLRVGSWADSRDGRVGLAASRKLLNLVQP